MREAAAGPSVLLLATGLVLAGAAGPAWAAPAAAPDGRAQAKEHYRNGLRHFNVDEYDQALEEFKRGYKLSDDPVFLFNIGQCHRKLRRPEEALTFYRRYLAQAPEAPNRGQVEQWIRELEVAATAPAAPAATPPPPALPPLGSAPTPVGETSPKAVAAPAPDGAPASPPVYRRWWFWAALGGAAALSVGAVVLLSRRDVGCGGFSPCYGVPVQ